MTEQKSHRDYVAVIGETHKTAKNYREARWNEYYAITYERIVAQMLAATSGTVLDVGTSYGHWYPFLKAHGYSRILGVEMDAARAAQARRVGYSEIFNTDAVAMPIADDTCDVAVSNDVFVHILKLEDKVAVFREVYRVLRPGGFFVVNHTMSRPHNYAGYHIEKHCSFLELDGWLKLIIGSTNFEILDIKQAYFNWRITPAPFITKVLRRLLILPWVEHILAWSDSCNAWRYPMDDADTVYVKLRKPAAEVRI